MSNHAEIEAIRSRCEHDAQVIQFLRSRMDDLNTSSGAFWLATQLLATSEQNLIEHRLRLDQLLIKSAAEAIPRSVKRSHNSASDRMKRY